MQRRRTIGQPINRIDARGKVTGETRYPADLPLPPGTLHLKVVWSDRPHARLLGIETRAALALPGVVAVFTAGDVPVNEFGIMIPDERVLAQGKVRFVGDPVALVAAEDEETAHRAAQRVHVTYEDLPAVFDPREAMQPGAPLVHEEKGSNILHSVSIRKGDVVAALAQADVIVESDYFTPFNEHAMLQPEAGLAYLEDGRVVVHTAAQWADDDRRQIAHALALPEDQVRVIYAAVGGAFGGREDVTVQILLALAAYKTGRPVRLVWNRQESIRGHHKRHPFYMHYKTGATRDGRVIATAIEIITDAGAYASSGIAVLKTGASLATGPYDIPNVAIDAHTVYTNNMDTGAMRGFGANQVCFASEMQMSKLAVALGMDPVEFRLKNVVREGSTGPTNTVLPVGTDGLAVTLQRTARAAGWSETAGHWQRPAGSETLAERGVPMLPPLPVHAPAAFTPLAARRRGLGVSCAWKNIGYSFGFPESSTAIVEIYGQTEMERVVVKCFAAEVGQGVATLMAQVAAEALAVPVERVTVINNDTDVAPDAGSSSASRQAVVTGNAVRLAALAAKARWDDEDRPAVARYQYKPGRTTNYAPETGECIPHHSYGYACHIAEVEVDTETGEVTLLKVWAGHDLGQAINRQGAEGQIEGGVVMGQGMALIEEFIQNQGQIVTGSLHDYLIPTSLDVPVVEPILVEGVLSADGPWGAKGLGEMPHVAVTPAIVAAIHDAVGVWVDRLPVTPERLLLSLRAGGGG